MPAGHATIASINLCVWLPGRRTAESVYLLKKLRNPSIDLLRILTIYMVIIVHLLHHGYLLEPAAVGTPAYYAAWLLNCLVYPAVNIFGMITGYVTIRHEVRFSRLLGLWFQVFFYSVVISVLFFIFTPENFTLTRVLNALFPVVRNQWWYFTSYVGMFFFLPFLNPALKEINRVRFRNILIVLFLLFSLFPTIFLKDPFVTYQGFSTIWLLILYLFGCYFGRFRIGNKKPLPFLLLYLGCTAISFLLQLRIRGLEDAAEAAADTALHDHLDKVRQHLLYYPSALMLLAAIGFLLFVVNLRIRNHAAARVICFFAAPSFGVYLLHDHPLVRNRFINQSMNALTQSSSLFSVFGHVLLRALVIYLLCSVIELLRARLFRLLRVSDLADSLSQRIFPEDEDYYLS